MKWFSPINIFAFLVAAGMIFWIWPTVQDQATITTPLGVVSSWALFLIPLLTGGAIILIGNNTASIGGFLKNAAMRKQTELIGYKTSIECIQAFEASVHYIIGCKRFGGKYELDEPLLMPPLWTWKVIWGGEHVNILVNANNAEPLGFATDEKIRNRGFKDLRGYIASLNPSPNALLLDAVRSGEYSGEDIQAIGSLLKPAPEVKP